jgi:hypothetical protein
MLFLLFMMLHTAYMATVFSCGSELLEVAPHTSQTSYFSRFCDLQGHVQGHKFRQRTDG